MPSRPLDRLRDGLLLAVLAAAAFSYFFALRGYHFEDAFITFRYAANLAAGDGFSFNPGERVFGTSTPLYTLLLAIVAWLGADPAVIGELVFCLALATAGGLGALVLRHAGYPNGAVFFALGAAWATGGVLRFLGMETTLYIALAIAMVGAAFTGRSWTTGILAGLLCLTRYDGVIPVAVLFLELWRQRIVAESSRTPKALLQALPWREIVGVTALLGSWLVFAWLYFGDPMPNTLGAKAGSSVSVVDYALRAARGQFLDITSPMMGWAMVPRVVLTAGLALVVLLGAPGLLRRQPRWWTLPAIAALLLIGYAVIGPPMGHRWYHVPGLYLGLLFAAAAAAHLGRRLPERVAVGTAIAALAFSLVAIPVTSMDTLRKLARGAAQRVATYDRFADWVILHDLDDLLLMTREPGYLTYRTGQRAIDGAGLVTEGIYYHGPADRRSQWHDLVDDFEPDLAVLHAWTGRPEGVFRERFVPVVQGPPERLLLIDRQALDGRATALAEAWRHGRWLDDATIDASSDTILLPDGTAPRARPDLEGRGAVWTRPFRISGDELHVLARGFGQVAVQLLVDGVTVLELDGAKLDRDTPTWRAIPTYPWRGRRAELRVADNDPQGEVALRDVRWHRYPTMQQLDDFERGPEEGFGSSWDAAEWSDAPTPTAELVVDFGLSPVLGAFTASSLGRPGVQTLRSQPFEIAHDRLVLIFGDFADGHATISLWIDDRRVLQVAGQDRQRLDFVKWDVSAFRGQRAVLSIRDGDPDPTRGLSVDEIVLVSNRPADPEPAPPTTASDEPTAR